MCAISASSVRILLILSLFFPSQAFAVDQFPRDSMYTFFAGVEPVVEILDPRGAQPGEAHKEADPCTPKDREAVQRFDEERRAVFDFDAQDAGGLFSESKWILLPDRFGFLPSSTFLNTSVRACASGRIVSLPLVRIRTFVLVGHLTSIESDGRTLELHGALEGPSGSLFTIDGFIRTSTQGAVLDAVYSVALQGAQQIGRVRLRLKPTVVGEAYADTVNQVVAFPVTHVGQLGDTDLTPEDFSRALAEFHARQEEGLNSGDNDKHFRSLVEAYQFRDESIDLDPVLFTVDEPNLIEGIPVNSRFDLNLTGTVDGIEFGPLPGMLMLFESERREQTISVLLSADDFSSELPGTINWSTSSDSSWEVQVTDGTLNLTLLDPQAGSVGSLLWTTMHNGAPTNAMPSRFDATLSIDGDRVQGSLEGEGYLGVDGSRSSRYSARISGVLHEHQLFNEVLARIGVLPLTGDWQTNNKALGIFRLRGTGEARNGAFGANWRGNLDGRITQGVMSFSWTTDTDAQGWGFLRPLPRGDRAIGLWGAASDRGDATPVLATQPRKPWDETSAAALSEEEVDLLRKLGRDLAGQGRCTQALSVLDLVWNGYDIRLKKKKSAERPDFEIYSDLVQMNTISRPMIECAFELGDFETTLERLRRALYLQREFNPVTRAQHAFNSQVASTGTKLQKMADRMLLLLENLESLRSPKVGLMFDPKGANQPLIIGAVGSGSPADRAGLRPGEEIISIDGEAARPLDTEGTLRALTGAEGTHLKLVVTGVNDQREVVVVRGPWYYDVSSPKRRLQLEQATETLRSSAEKTRSTLLSLGDAIKQITAPDEPSAEAFDAAYKQVIDRIEAERSRIPERIRRLTALGESLFGDWDRYMPIQRFVLHTYGQMIGEPGYVPFAERPHTVQPDRPLGVVEDEMLNALYADPSISGPEASLFFEHLKASVLTLGLIRELGEASRGLELWKQHAQPTPEAMAAHARRTAGFSQWLERWRARLALDQTKIAALDAAAIFAREWLAFLWELESKTEGVSRGGAIEALLATESVRNRAMQDLLAGRTNTSPAQQGRATTTLTSLRTQATLEVDELLDLVKARGGTTVVYQSLDEHLLVWIMDAMKLSCTVEAEPETVERTLWSDPDDEILTQLLTVTEGQYPLQDTVVGHYNCNGIEAFQLEVSADDIKTYADTFQQFASSERISRDDGSVHAFARLLHEMYRRLIAPVAHLLPNDPEAVVTIIPDAELFQIPFGALISTPVNDDMEGFRYMIEDHTLVYLTSIGMMRFTQENARQAEEAAATELVTLWDPVGIEYSGFDPFFRGDQERVQPIGYLKAHYPAGAAQHVFIGADATRENLFASASKASVLTFVTHAKASEIPGDDRGTYIALAGAPLPVTDVYGLDLHVDLAILAGCETGRGRIGADGVVGLSRAFTFAGAPTLAMSLWQIPDKETVLMLHRFYRAYFKEGKSKAHALRQAQLEAVSEFASVPQPNLWAGMVLFGQP